MASHYPDDEEAAREWIYDFLSDEDKEKAQSELKENGPSGLRKFLEQKLNEYKETPVSLILFYVYTFPFKFNYMYVISNIKDVYPNEKVSII